MTFQFLVRLPFLAYIQGAGNDIIIIVAAEYADWEERKSSLLSFGERNN